MSQNCSIISKLNSKLRCHCQVCEGAGVVGSFRDPAAVAALATHATVVTVEIEHVDCVSLAELEAVGQNVQPSAATIALIQDKWVPRVLCVCAFVRVCMCVRTCVRVNFLQFTSRTACLEFGSVFLLHLPVLADAAYVNNPTPA